MIEIPLTSAPEQEFTTTIMGQDYDCVVKYNWRAGYWSMNFSQGGVCLLGGVVLLGGVDILSQHNLPFRNMHVMNLAELDQDPNESNLGESARLFVFTDEEIEEIRERGPAI